MDIIHRLYTFIRDTTLLIAAGAIVTYVGLAPILQISILGSDEHSPWEAALSLSAWYIVATLAGRIFSAIRNSLKEKTLSQRLAVSPKILYLRSFKNDKQEISEGIALSIFEIFFSVFQSFDPLKTLNQTFSNRFETRLSEICNKYGCLICLSNNLNKISTPPEGSLRIITKDDDWKKVFARNFDESIYTIVLVDKSPALEWELGQILSSGRDNRVL